MAENKTKATAGSPRDYLAAIADDTRRKGCETLALLMAKVSNLPAVMWGPSIVGFGVHTYPLSGGKQGEICAIGFSSRTSDISIYGVTGHPRAAALLASLGKHTLGKGCLYVKRLADVDLEVLETLFAESFKARHVGSNTARESA